MNILVTGTAGFIGYHVAKRLLDKGNRVVGFDNLNAYYDVNLKKARLAKLEPFQKFQFIFCDLINKEAIIKLFQQEQFDQVVHLAAQAGVRYSLKNPHTYVDSNLVGFVNLLEGCQLTNIKHLLYASSSSVYGANTAMPYSVHHHVDHPLSIYAATKRANELMAHTYSHLYHLPTTGLRFFTVYGPWCRSDMALFQFTQKILAGEPIDVFNYGKHRRDFTYIDDITDGVVHVLDKVASPNNSWSGNAPDIATSLAPYRLYNIGNNQPVELMVYIKMLEKSLGKKATLNLLPLQKGDVLDTYADINDLECDVGFKPKTSVEEGIDNFVKWYRYYMSC